jgi:RNA polymerase sigma-70 factor (ECF subfamily)
LATKAINLHQDLIEKAVENDEAAQFELYKKYNGAMYNTALRITGGNTALAEDALQESFLSAFRSLAFYRGDSTFGAWLKRIVVNTSLSMTRKEGNWTLTDDLPEPMEEAGDYEEDYDVERVRDAIEQLPTGFRTVLSLYLLEGYDHKEIAEILDITESTSKSQYKRAKDKLKKILKERSYG